MISGHWTKISTFAATTTSISSQSRGFRTGFFDKGTATMIVTVARIKVPAPDFDSREQNLACDNLSFHTWHGLPEHRPIGGINRLRKAVYEAVSAYRHERNGASDAAGP